MSHFMLRALSLHSVTGHISSLPVTQTFLALIVFAASIFIGYQVRGVRKENLPRGPLADPIIGHLRQVPQKYPWIKFADWCKKYGDIVYVNVLGKPMVVVGTAAAAKELMETRGANYSDRPRVVLQGELMGWEKMMSLLPYGERHRSQRRLLQPFLTSQSVHDFYPIIQSRARKYLKQLYKSPDGIMEHIHGYVSSTVVMVTYGYEFKSADDPRREMVERVVKMTIEAGSAGTALVDFMPYLKHIPSWAPGAGFKRHALKTRKYIQEMFDEFLNETTKGRAEGTLPPDARLSLVYRLLEKYEGDIGVDLQVQEDIRNATGVMYSAGVETTEAAIQTFFLMMTLHPEFAKRAQDEIDAVIGSDRLLTLEDICALPYVTCIVQEVYRWNPPAPLGLPHASISNDVYHGMRIPARTMVVPNIWQMCRDEKLYKSPHVFDPGRFYDEHIAQHEAGENLRQNDPRGIVFGFGRRICPGEHLANAIVWLAIASTLAEFDIFPVKDKNGEDILPDGSFQSGLVTYPTPFKCIVLPRKKT